MPKTYHNQDQCQEVSVIGKSFRIGAGLYGDIFVEKYNHQLP